MTAPTTTAPARRPTDSGGRRLRRPSRGVVIAVALTALVALVAVLLPGGRATRPLDPDSTASNGSRALARVLSDRGVQIHPVRSVDELRASPTGADTTLLVVGASDLSERAMQTIRERDVRRLVLVEPHDPVLDGLELGASTVGRAGRLTAGCRTATVGPEDTISAGAVLYRPDDDGLVTCFHPEQDPESTVSGARAAAHLVFPATASRPEIVVLGQGDMLAGAHITRETHAAIALRLLGSTDRVVWFVPTPDETDPPLETTAPSGPAWIGPVLTVLALTAVLLCLWRGRRLGPLTVEPLPVVVPAGETTRARGRLYRRADDRQAAAATLSDAALRDLRRRLRIPADAPLDRVATVAAQATGDDRDAIVTLLSGRCDTTLGEHAARLRRLRRKVRLT